MSADRRTFLKMSAMAAATAAAARVAPSAAAGSDFKTLAGSGVSWDKAPCRYCGTGCHVQVGVQGGKVVAVAGDPDAEVNKGLLCVKGYHVGLALYGQNRLTKPQLRVNGRLQDISWEKAISIIADRVEANPAGFAIYGSGQWTIPEGFAAQKFMKGGLSNNNIDPNARLCMASAVTGFLATFGVDEPSGTYTDLDKADVIICWGNNPAEMHPVLFSRIIDRRSRGESVTLIDIGTRRTRTTAHAQHYLEFKPQTDLAIANCIAHLLVKNGTYNKDFVEKYCNFRKDADEPGQLFGVESTWDEYVKHLEEYTPEYVSQLSGVSADDLRLLGRLFGDPKVKITSLWCMGTNQHTRGTAMNTLLHGIHLLSGKICDPGNSGTSLTGQPSACGTAREVGTLAHALPGGRIVKKDAHREHCEGFWNLPAGRINPKPGTHTVAMWKSWSTPKSEEGGHVDTIWVQVTNPGQTLPNRGLLIDPGVKDPDKFLIVSEVYPTATTEIADLVLPASCWVEKNGIFGNSERRTQQWFKMVNPPGDARDDCWMTIAVAYELFKRGFEGMKDKDGNFLFEMKDESGRVVPTYNWKNYYDMNVDKWLFEEYRPFTTMKRKDLAPYEEYVKARGMRWPVVEQPDGSWKETEFRFAEGYDPYVEEGKGVQFYNSSTKDDRAQIWIRPYDPPPESPDEDYPFWLCTGRVLEHWHTGTMTRRVKQLADAMPQAYVEIHRDDAKELNIRNGERVLIETRRGSLELNAWIDGRGKPPRGSLFVPFFDERLLINYLTLHDFDPFSKQPDYKKCAVRVKKISGVVTEGG